MIKRGIFTTISEIWFHLHPFIPSLYYYRVKDCREFIATNSLIAVAGRSKDGTISATGYLVTKDAPFIKRRSLRCDRVGETELWRSMTDREVGLRGEEIVISLLRLGIFPELGMRVRVIMVQADQYAGRDITVGKYSCEIKTERVISLNLFVQNAEGGHRPTLLPDGTVRSTEMPTFALTKQLSLIEKTAAERAGHANGFVGYDDNGHFVHYCNCGKDASFGFGFSLKHNNLGRWYCQHHKPIGNPK
jgi:hypothetical protein